LRQHRTRTRIGARPAIAPNGITTPFQELTMGLLDSVIGALGQAQGQTGPAFGGGAAAGGGADVLSGVIGMLGQGGGGLGALVQKFQQAGLGDVVASWIATGPNQAISGEQLGRVLGPDALGGVAQQLGLDSNELMGQLAQMLPGLVDQLTPDGQLPQAGQLSGSGLENLAGMLGGTLRR
jgi:uncharacterized protein YidB (DUF937 family)